MVKKTIYKIIENALARLPVALVRTNLSFDGIRGYHL